MQKSAHKSAPDILTLDSDKENINQETLDHQYEMVKWETNTSAVCRFGDPSMGSLRVADFQGNKDAHANVKYDTEGDVEYEMSEITDIKTPEVDPSWFSCGRDAVPSHEVIFIVPPIEIVVILEVAYKRRNPWVQGNY